jgi:hypothetical protein
LRGDWGWMVGPQRFGTRLILADFVGSGDKLCHFGTKVSESARGGNRARVAEAQKNQEHQIALVLLSHPPSN